MSAGFDIRLPNLTEGDEKEQLRQIRSYLYQLAGQLQFALGGGNQTPAAQLPESGPGLSFPSVKKQIIRSGEIMDAWYDAIHRRMEEQILLALKKGFETDDLTARRGTVRELRMGDYCWSLDEDGHCSLK